MVLTFESNHVAERDGHISRTLPGSSAGPNKAGARAPTGANALATELAAEADAQHDLAQARAEGDAIDVSNEAPPSLSSATAGDLGIGMPNGAEPGVTDPSDQERDALQEERNQAFHGAYHAQNALSSSTQSAQPTLADLARTSKASAASHPTLDQRDASSHARPAAAVLDQVSRSTGTESGTGAAGAAGAASSAGEQVEIGRDATTSNVA